MRLTWLLLALFWLTPASAETGMASVDYGRATSFDGGRYGGRVSTGARFDAKLLAIAHRTLPLGSYVLVTFRKRTALAVVNDRGPCLTVHCQRSAPRRVRERIADLTPGLARYLRFPGLGRVSLATVRP